MSKKLATIQFTVLGIAVLISIVMAAYIALNA